MSIRRAFAIILFVTVPTSASAFDYLEHSFLTDHACHEAQLTLAKRLLLNPGDRKSTVRYLALALACPADWRRPYCADGYKQAEANINELTESPATSGDHSVTLGDFAALPDHISDFGAVRGVPRAAESGLLTQALGWLAAGSGDPGGVVADVAEDACETDDTVDWAALESSLLEPASPLPSTLRSRLRGLPETGPRDSAGAYSFDNPHYLDMVLANHHHFGGPAYDAWLGFHRAAVEIADAPCEQTIDLDADEVEAMGAGSDVGSACEVLGHRIAERLQRWSLRAEKRLVDPVRAKLSPAAPFDATLAIEIGGAFMGLVLEGVGLHFLQDSLAAGHIRVDRGAYGLAMARHQHDADGLAGVRASFGGASSMTEFVAFGDGYLLGPGGAAEEGSPACDPQGSNAAATTCLIEEHRRLVHRSTTASILDWSLGGAMYSGDCITAPVLCRDLPTRRPTVGSGSATDLRGHLGEGNIPGTPPPFSYQSLSVALAVESAGKASELGVRLAFLSPLGGHNWLTSYNIGALTAPTEFSSTFEFAYLFHWRWAARFLINAGPYALSRVENLGTSPRLAHGLGASFGFSVLPEGWIRMPLEFTLTVRTPVTLLRDTTMVREFDGLFIEIATGLAFL